MVESGAVLHGKYRIEQVLGKGGMGVVARALHLDLDKPVALKLLRPDVLQSRDAVERFRREARAMGQLTSEHVCRVFDVGMLDNGAHYMVMEYLEGKDLGLILREQKRLAPGFAVDLVLQACEALAEVHALGIVHRDIKPANCFLTRGPDGEPLLKVLDFGIAKAPGGADDGITTSQSIIGSPSYMSPEQMRSSKHVDARTDIWALGVVLYELVSGRRPFASDHFAGMCLAVTTTPMLPLDDVALPDGLAEIIARCLEKEPDQRIGSMAELSAALAPYAGTSAQGERSSVRTARILERAGTPPKGLPGLGTTMAGERRRSERTQTAQPRRMPGPEPGTGPTLEPTVTAGPDEPTNTTGRTTRPLPPKPRPRGRPRPRWLLAVAGLAMFALLLVLGAVLGARNWPGPYAARGDQAGGDGAASPGFAPEVARTPGGALDGRREAQTASGGAGANPEPAAVPAVTGARSPAADAVPAVTGARSPAASAQVETTSSGTEPAESAARSGQAGVVRPARRRGVEGPGQPRGTDARPVTQRAPARSAPKRAAQAGNAPVAGDALLDDEALTSQH